MTETGWMGEEPDAAGPPMPVTSVLLSGSRGEPQPGGVLDQALARARAQESREIRDQAAVAVDPDEYAAGLIGRGYLPGMMSQLSQRLADTAADLESERVKIEEGERVTGRVRRLLERGQLGGLEANQMLDGDFGDAHRAEQLERRCASLRRQIAEAAEAMTPPEARARDVVEAAASRAQAILKDVARQRQADDEAETRGRKQMKAERAAFRAAGGRRPFVSHGGVVRSSEVTCPGCAAAGATADESFLIHSDPRGVIGRAGRASDGRPWNAPGPEIVRDTAQYKGW